MMGSRKSHHSFSEIMTRKKSANNSRILRFLTGSMCVRLLLEGIIINRCRGGDNELYSIRFGIQHVF